MRKQIVMRLTAFVLLTVTLHCSAAGFTQNKITLKDQNAPLEKVLQSIKKQSGFALIYTKQMLERAVPVTIDLKDASLADALDACLSRQPLVYTIVNETIVLKAKPESQLKVQSPTNDVTGRVTNSAGEPLAGASVIVKRTGRGDIADANGNFKLKNVNPDDVIEVSFTGYKTLSVKLGGASVLPLTLDVAVDELDRAVVQAYGKTTKRLATGNIAKVTAAEIERQPVMNPLLALQGRVSGLDVKQINGFASAPIKIELRGRSTIRNDFTSDPLYIIDGVPLTVLEISGSSNYTNGSTGFLQNGYNGPAGGQSPFFNINPNDIESIEILKDADATSIYGSRGANGVMLITTKKAKAGKTKFDLNIQQGIQKVTRFWDMANTAQYIAFRKEAIENSGYTPYLVPAFADYFPDILIWDTTKYTDWQRKLYGKTGQTLGVQGSLSGGNPQTNFRIASGYNRTTNILSISGADQRGSVSFNFTHKTIDQKFELSITGGYSASKSDMIFLPASVTLPPNAPDIYDSFGNLNYDGWGGANSSTVARSLFPFFTLKQPYNSRTNFLNTNSVLGFQPNKNLRFSISLGYNNAQSTNRAFNLIASQDPKLNPTGDNQIGYSNNRNIIIEPQANYASFIGKGKITILVGGSVQQTHTEGLRFTGRGYTSDALIKSISSAPIKNTTSFDGRYKYAGAFGRLNYNWQDKYVISLNARRDGSSRFGDDKQWANFGSLGYAWIVSNEDFFTNNISFVSFLKLRGSYGITGSDAIGDYKYLTRWSTNGSSEQFYNGILPLVPQQHANPNYQWQVDKKIEGGIDIAVLKERLTLSVVYYRNRCGNQLLDFPLPNLTGFSSVAGNSPALVQNDGFEFNLGATIIKDRNFYWSIHFNTALNRNKLLSYPNIEESPYANTLVVGKPLNIIKLLRYTGVNRETGEYTFEDKNHDGVINTDMNASTNDLFDYYLNPKFFGGLGLDFRYKNLSLNLFFNIKKQLGANAFYMTVSNAGFLGNQPTAILGKYWQKPGDDAGYAKLTMLPPASNFYFSGSNGIFTDASYIRLSNLSLSYKLSPSFARRLYMQGCDFFIHASNLFVITNYSGLDPETQNFGGMPPNKTIAAGINFNF